MRREELDEMYHKLDYDRVKRTPNYSVDDLIFQVHKCKELGLTPKQHQEALGYPRRFVLALWEYVFLDLPSTQISP